MDSGVAARNGISHGMRDLVERDVVNAKSPHEVIDVADMLLVGLWRKQGFEEPTAIVDLADVAQLR